VLLERVDNKGKPGNEDEKFDINFFFFCFARFSLSLSLSLALSLSLSLCVTLSTDEFQVTEVADALIMRRLFGMLFEHGCVVVATSNRAPEDLYKDGLNRPLFVPFIDLLKQRCEVLYVPTGIDYRMQRKLRSQMFNQPLNEQSRQAMEEFFRGASSKEPTPDEVGARDVPVMMGRTLHVERACGKVAQFRWHDLCAKPLGSSDYLAIAHHFHTVLITDIPRMDHLMLNEARRFITLIDILYEHNVRVAFSAAVPDTQLFEMNANDVSVLDQRIDRDRMLPDDKHTIATEGRQHREQDREHLVSAAEYGAVKDISFAFARTLSRIKEMQSEEYWQKFSLKHKT
jgi:predicted ATPase